MNSMQLGTFLNFNAESEAKASSIADDSVDGLSAFGDEDGSIF